MRQIKETIRRFLPRTTGQHAVLSGPLRGVPIVTSWHDYPGAILGRTERPLLAWFERNVSTGETWLDVGAHFGYTAVAISRLVGSKGRVFAFEPILGSAACMRQTGTLNGLSQLNVVPLALSESPYLESVELGVVRGMAGRTYADSRHVEKIYTISLDAIWPTLCNATPEIHGIKIDVQGMEVEVLKGMKEVLTLHRPKLAIEVHSGVSREALNKVLSECGYRTVGSPIGNTNPAVCDLYEDDKSYEFQPESGCPAALSQS